MIMENQVLLMILDMFIKKENKRLMDILMVRLSMKKVEMMSKVFFMDILIVTLSMMNKIIILQPNKPRQRPSPQSLTAGTLNRYDLIYYIDKYETFTYRTYWDSGR